jgi:hypothetical protein
VSPVVKAGHVRAALNFEKSEKKLCQPPESSLHGGASRQKGLDSVQKNFEKSEKKACHRFRDWIIPAKT